MKCDEVRLLLRRDPRYVPRAEIAAVAAHIWDCRDCRKFMDAVAETVRASKTPEERLLEAIQGTMIGMRVAADPECQEILGKIEDPDCPNRGTGG